MTSKRGTPGRALVSVMLGGPYMLYAGLFLLFPVGVLALYSFWSSGFLQVVRDFTIENYREIVADDLYRDVLFRSIGIGLLVAALVVLLGFVLAYALTFRLGRWGTRLLVLVVASTLASYVVRVFALGTILGTNGLVNRLLLRAGVIDEPLRFLYFSYFSIVVTLVYVYLPLAVLILYAGLQGIDPRMMEASRDMGAGRWRTLGRVVVPLARAGALSAFALTFILATADYVAPSIVGGTKGLMIGTLIESTFLKAGDIPLGAALAFVALGATVLSLGAVFLGGKVLWAIGKRVPSRSWTPRAEVQRPLSGVRRILGRRHLSPVLALVLIAFLMAPLVVIVVFSFNRARTVGLPFTGFTFDWYTDVANQVGFPSALQTSFQVVGLAVVGSLLLGVPAAFALLHWRGTARLSLWLAVYGPIVVPGIVIGVAFFAVTTYLAVPLGVVLTSLAHVLLTAPFVVLVLRVRLLDLDPRLAEAARDLGARPRRVLRTVTLPIVLPALFGIATLSAAFSLDEIFVTSFTIGADSTLPVWVLSQGRKGFTPGVNAVAAMILTATLLLFVAGSAALRRGSKKSASELLEAVR